MAQSLVAVLLGFALAQQDIGHIEIRSEPGVQIYLDGVLRGTTNSESKGLIIQSVSMGTHVIRAVKAGFSPQEARITLQNSQVLLHVIDPFIPVVRIRQEGVGTGGTIEAQVGTVIIQSLPIEAMISSPSAGLDNEQKTNDRWIADNFPAGKHTLRFFSRGKPLTADIDLEPGGEIHLMVNFIEETVIDLSGPELPEVENPVRRLPSDEPERPRRPTARLSAQATTIVRGQFTTLEWVARDATDVRLEPNIGPVPHLGKRRIWPSTDVTYTLVAESEYGSRTDSVIVMVTEPMPAVRFGGLMWARDDSGIGVDWSDALAYCTALRLEDYTDWRLPTIAELKQLYDPSISYLPSMSPLKPVHVKSPIRLTTFWVWSSDRQGSYFDFADGDSRWFPADSRDTFFSALCVRDLTE